jgi:hypothetical protein
MIPLAIAPALSAVGSVARTWWKAGLGALVAAPLFFILGQCDGRQAGEIKAREALSQAAIKASQVDAAAKDAAAIERQADTTIIQTQTKELTDAVQAAPSSAPDAARVALNCARLRQAGRDTSAIPVCR